MDFKTIGNRIAFAFSLIVFASAALAAPSVYKLHVDGLSCPFCAYGIEKKLGTVRGVQHIEVDIASGTVKVTMAEGEILDESAAKQAVKEAGFSLHSLEQIRSSSQQGQPQDQAK